MKHIFQEQFKAYLQQYLKLIRKKLGLTQEELAEQLHISTRAYNDLERGVTAPSAATLALLLDLMTDETMVQLVRGFCQKILQMEQHIK